ncbi:hypothetical protein C9J60_21105 [Streptomyces sp. A244]|nr:hypothetical protein C9J60_21105 [Streptomyces sp. A244]
MGDPEPASTGPECITRPGITMIGPGPDVKKSRREHADTVHPLSPRPTETEGAAASVQGAAPRTVIDEREAL